MLSFFCILSIYLPTYSTILLMFLSKMIPLFHYFFAWWGWRDMDKKKSRKWANCHCHRTYVFAEYLFLNNIINTKTYTPSSLICFLLSPFHIFHVPISLCCLLAVKKGKIMKSNQNFHNRMKNRCCCFVTVMCYDVCFRTRTTKTCVYVIFYKRYHKKYSTNKATYFCALSTKHKRRWENDGTFFIQNIFILKIMMMIINKIIIYIGRGRE